MPLCARAQPRTDNPVTRPRLRTHLAACALALADDEHATIGQPGHLISERFPGVYQDILVNACEILGVDCQFLE